MPSPYSRLVDWLMPHPLSITSLIACTGSVTGSILATIFIHWLGIASNGQLIPLIASWLRLKPMVSFIASPEVWHTARCQDESGQENIREYFSFCYIEKKKLCWDPSQHEHCLSRQKIQNKSPQSLKRESFTEDEELGSELTLEHSDDETPSNRPTTLNFKYNKHCQKQYWCLNI